MSLESGRFTKINESFICEKCGRSVLPSATTCRNHCPFCLHSKHVDELPGDRLNPCGGLLVPTDYELSGKKGIVLVFRCCKCKKTVKNRALTEDLHQPDDYDAILALSRKKRAP